jgi:septal ring factor EnvC (AmiA/AmiB activator)
MKTLLPVAVLSLLPLTAAFARQPDPSAAAIQAAPGSQESAQQSLDERVAALEIELAAEKRRHDETRELLTKTLTYLEEQSAAADKLLATLTESEKQGFAVGENWRSRQTLLAGFRAYWGAKTTNLPKAPKPAVDKGAAKAPMSQRPARR